MKPQAIICAFSFCLLLLTGCSPKNTEPLRIGTNPWPGYEFLHLAQEKGYYKEAGLDVRLVEFSSLADCRRAYERGQIDGMGTTVIEVLQARDHSSRSPQIVQAVDYSDGADVILGRPGLNSGKNLVGKRIGVELASLGIYVLARGLDNFALSLTEVETVSLDQISMEEALKKGEIDAAVTYPPFSINLQRDGNFPTLFSTKSIPGEVIDVIAVEQKICEERKAEVAALIKCFQRAVAFTKANPKEAYAMMAARQGISPEEFGKALTDGIVLIEAADQADYFAPHGKLDLVINQSDRILRETKQITGPDRRANITQPFFAQP